MEMTRREKYENALSAVRAHRIRDAFELYISLFLPRCHRNREFLSFYRMQLAQYLIEKRNWRLALSEGDMVSDLIEMTYDETVSAIESSEIPVSPDCRINILSQVEIIFPCQKDTASVKRKERVAK